MTDAPSVSRLAGQIEYLFEDRPELRSASVDELVERLNHDDRFAAPGRRIRPRATTTCAAASTSSRPASRRRWWRRRSSGSRAEHRRKPPTARVRRSGMRARLGVLGMLAACTLALAGAVPAHAGGSNLQFERDHYEPGERAIATGGFGPGCCDRGWLEDGPYYAWLVPSDETQRAEAALPNDVVPIGEVHLPAQLGPYGGAAGQKRDCPRDGAVTVELVGVRRRDGPSRRSRQVGGVRFLHDAPDAPERRSHGVVSTSLRRRICSRSGAPGNPRRDRR